MGPLPVAEQIQGPQKRASGCQSPTGPHSLRDRILNHGDARGRYSHSPHHSLSAMIGEGAGQRASEPACALLQDADPRRSWPAFSAWEEQRDVAAHQIN